MATRMATLLYIVEEKKIAFKVENKRNALTYQDTSTHKLDKLLLLGK